MRAISASTSIIPFCQHQCAYCSFYTVEESGERLSRTQRFLAAVERRVAACASSRASSRGDALAHAVHRWRHAQRQRRPDLAVVGPACPRFDVASWGSKPLSELDEVTVECNPENVDADAPLIGSR